MLPAVVMQDLDVSEVSNSLDMRGKFTRAVPRDLSLKPASVVLLVEPGASDADAIVAVARLAKGPIITSFDRRVTLTNFIEVEPVMVAPLWSATGPRTRHHARAVLSNGGAIPDKTWSSLRNIIQTRHPGLRDAIESVEARHAPPEWIRRPRQGGRQTVELEKDATGLAVALTGIDRSVLTEWTPGDEPAPFLTGLDEFIAYEDPMIERDLTVFGDWALFRSSLIGAVEFEKRGHRVTIVNVNRRGFHVPVIDLPRFDSPTGLVGNAGCPFEVHALSSALLTTVPISVSFNRVAPYRHRSWREADA